MTRAGLRSRLLLSGLLVAVGCLLTRATEACLWDDELRAAAQSRTLPCIYDAVSGAVLEHDPSFDEARLAAAEAALEWAPNWADGLDMKAVALMRLGRLKQAHAVLVKRAAVYPEAYGTHTNLAVLHLLNGEHAQAATHAARAAKVAPAERATVAGLVARLAAFSKAPADGASFLGLELERDARVLGSPKRFARAKANPAHVDALVTMIAKCGLQRQPHVYFALGDLVALRGMRKTAYAAYLLAGETGHPDRPRVERILRRLRAMMPPRPTTDYPFPGAWQFVAGERDLGALVTRNFRKWQRKRVAKGERVWNAPAYATVARKRHRLRRRCLTPLLDGKHAPMPKQSSGATP